MRKYTKLMLDRDFPTEESCLEWLFKSRWPNGVSCKKCGKVTPYFRIRTKKVYGCALCGTQVSPAAGTIFHKSETPLRSWLYAIFLMASTRTGVASLQLERELGVNHRTALRMFRQIRTLMAETNGSLYGDIEVDETYIGGKRPGKRGRGAAGKTIVVGMVERHGNAIVRVKPNVRAATLIPFIQEHVPSHAGTTVFTDELPSYNKLTGLGYPHETVQHVAKEYVRGVAHVNNIENVWSNIKRGIDGVNHSVTPAYLQTYLDSYVFRYNHRSDETPLFQQLLQRAASPIQ